MVGIKLVSSESVGMCVKCWSWCLVGVFWVKCDWSGKWYGFVVIELLV